MKRVVHAVVQLGQDPHSARLTVAYNELLGQGLTARPETRPDAVLKVDEEVVFVS